MTEQSTPTDRPDWFLAPLRTCASSLRETMDLIGIARNSIEGQIGNVRLVEALENYSRGFDEDFSEEVSQTRVSRARTQAETARNIIDSDFRLLHSNGVVLVWAYLETLVNDLLLLTILNNPKFHEFAEWKDVKIPVARFVAMTREDQAEYLAVEVSQQLLQRSKSDAIPLEKILGLAGLDGPHPDNLNTALYVMQKVRNLIAHRGGTVDSRFLEDCAMLNATIGMKLKISGHAFATVGLVAVRYVYLIEERCCALYGGTPRATWESGPVDVVGPLIQNPGAS